MKKSGKRISQERKTGSAEVPEPADRSEKTAEPSSTPLPISPSIVGIGASAGGLEAFTQLLRALPTDTGMAFVLVQHLEPKHESVLTTLLARATKMPVREVREGMGVEPNHVYVIPANADLSLLDGLLHIVGRKAAAGLEKEIDQIVWERYEHAGVVVDGDLQILHFRGDTSPYLRPAPGKASLQLMRILREEIVLEVRTALQKAQRTGGTVRREGVEIRHNRRVSEVNIEVRPLPVHNGHEKCFLILFEMAPAVTAPAKPGAGHKSTKAGTRELLRLRNELARNREHVRAIIRDQESTNEELKTANEEALSSMEELQSTNEELETAKEELQSGNEELITLNEQLQNRNAELASRSDQLNNVLTASDIPILVLDSDRRIRLFTPPAEKVMGLLPADVGRPIGKLRLGVHVPELEDLISTVIQKGTDARREVQTDEGRWYLLHIRPFWTGAKNIEGALMALVDIDGLKRNQVALQTERNFIAAVLDAAKDLLVVVLDRAGRIVHFNQMCQQLTGYSLKEVKGRRVWDFLLPPEEMGLVKTTFDEVAGGTANRRQNHWIAKDGRHLLISWSNTVAKSDGEVESVIATGFDITEREVAGQRAQESEATIHALMQSVTQAVLSCDQDGRIILANPAAEKMFGYVRDDLVGRSLESLIPARFRERHVLHRSDWSANLRNRPMGTGLELEALRKDGSEFPIDVSLSYIETPSGVMSVAFIADITERKQLAQTLSEYKDQLQKLTGALLFAQESGNREVARELHDVFSQELAAAGMEISSLKQKLKARGEIAKRLSNLGAKIARLSEDIHRKSRELHPAVLEELGLEPALRQECETFQQSSGIPTGFTSANLLAKIPQDVALCLYRVTQECFRNIRKHAPESSAVRISLGGGPDGITVCIEDNGNGFELDAALRKGGLGLISMEERVRLVNGKLTVRSQPGKGTTVTAFVPLEKKPA